ncbi:hypothetical protein C8R44DRAFT_563729, partial [Mycena epipterygia]
PTGTVWDSVNYSCAYDAMVSPMYNIWKDHGVKWSDMFQMVGEYVGILAKGFESVQRGTAKIEGARDSMRAALRRDCGELFPSGQYLTSIDDLAQKLYGSGEWGVSQIKCPKCGRAQEAETDFSAALTITYCGKLRSRYNADYSISHWLRDRMIQRTTLGCVCGSGMLKLITINHAPPLIYLSLSDTDILIDSALNLKVGDFRQRYALRGVIYGGENHFTSRIIKPNGEMWYHDGIET